MLFVFVAPTQKRSFSMITAQKWTLEYIVNEMDSRVTGSKQLFLLRGGKYAFNIFMPKTVGYIRINIYGVGELKRGSFFLMNFIVLNLGWCERFFQRGGGWN